MTTHLDDMTERTREIRASADCPKDSESMTTNRRTFATPGNP